MAGDSRPGSAVGASEYAQQLAQQKGNALKKKKSKKRVVFKEAVGSPYSLQWPALGQDDSGCVLAVLASLCKGIEKKKRRGGGKKTGRVRNGTPDGLLVGVNEVTKALERSKAAGEAESSADPLRLVLLCSDVRPLVLVEHVPMLCALRKVPLCVLGGKERDCSFRLGAIFGLRSAMALGIRESACGRLARLVEYCSTRLCPVQLPWAQGGADGPKATYEPLVMQPRKKRRKLGDEEAAEVTA